MLDIKEITSRLIGELSAESERAKARAEGVLLLYEKIRAEVEKANVEEQEGD